jgi:hypothetical protein
MSGQYWSPGVVNGIASPLAPQQPQQQAPQGGGRYWSPGMVNGIASPMYQQPQQQLPGLLGQMPQHTQHPPAGFNPRNPMSAGINPSLTTGLPPGMQPGMAKFDPTYMDDFNPVGPRPQGTFGSSISNGGLAALMRMMNIR